MENKFLRLSALLLVMMLVGVNGAWGQIGTIADIDFSNSISDGKVNGSTNYISIGGSNTEIIDERLAIGKGTSFVTVPEAQRAGTVVTVSFELAFGKLVNRSVYFHLKDESGVNIATFDFNAYSAILETDLGVELGNMYYNNPSVDWERKVSFNITLNYNTQKITTVTECYKSGEGGTLTTASHEVDMESSTDPFATFEIGSNYDNNDRRCQFDNLRITTNLCSYTVKTNASYNVQQIASGIGVTGSTIVVPYPKYINVDGTLYHKGVISQSYKYSFGLDADHKEENLNYEASAETNVVYLKEAEDIMSRTEKGGNNSRSSNAAGGYTGSLLDLVTLPKGAYQIKAAAYSNNQTTFTFSSGDESVYSFTGNGYWQEFSSTIFQTKEDVPIRVQGGSQNYGLDYIFIKAIFAYQEGSSSGICGNTATPTLVNPNNYTVTYDSSNKGVATVNATTGEVTFVHNGWSVITAKATINGVDYFATHTVTVTGESQATGTFNNDAENKKEEYTITGTGYLPENNEGTTISIAFGNPDETQSVESMTDNNSVTKSGVCGIDANNFSHVLFSGIRPSMGSYFVFTPKANGTLKIHGLLKDGTNGIRLTDQDGNILEKIRISNVHKKVWEDYTFHTLLTSGATYYVFAETQWMIAAGSQAGDVDYPDNTSAPTLYLNSFVFTQMEGTTISLIDQSLLFTPNNNANYHRLDRTIPGFEIKFEGGDGAKYQNNGTFILRNSQPNSEEGNGSITITPRVKVGTGVATDVVITSVKLNTGYEIKGSPSIYINGEGKGSVVKENSTLTYSSLSGNILTIKLKGYDLSEKNKVSFLLNSITFTYTLNNGVELDDSKGTIDLRFADDYVYGYTGETKKNDLYFDSPVAFYGDVSLQGSGGMGFAEALTNAMAKHKNSDEKIHFNDGDTDSPYKVLIGTGVCYLSAKFLGTNYFAPATAVTRLYSHDYTDEPSWELAAGKSYKVPAANGLYFAITTSGGNIELTGAKSPSTLADDERYLTTVTGSSGEVVITNTGSSDVTIKKIEVYRKQGRLDFTYSGMVGADKDVIFCGETYLPQEFTIKDENGNEESDWAEHYETTGTYTLVNPLSGVSINSTTGEITVAEDATQDYLDVMLTVNPEDEYKALYGPITKTIHVKVVSGMWDFRTYTVYDNNSMEGSAGWSKGFYVANRDNAEFEYIYRNDNTPLPQAFSLQTRGHHRFVWSKTAGNSCLHLFGRGVGSNTSPNGGGEVRVPVKAGMLVEINANADDRLSEMELEGVTTLDGEDVTYFYVNDGAPESQYFLAKNDGYFVIKNPSHNLYLYLRYIKVSAEMAFRYGNETYVDARVGSFTNGVMNKGETTITYTYENKTNTPATTVNTSTGEATLGASYGIYEVTATGSGAGLLNGKVGTYTVTAIGLDVNNHTENIAASGVKTDNLVVRCLKIIVGNTFGDDGTVEQTAAIEDIKSKLKFTVLNPAPGITLSGANLTIEGARTVQLKVTLGAIEKTFTYTITGGTLNQMNPVIANDATSYTIEIVGVEDEDVTKDYTFNVKKMYEAIRGDLYENRAALVFKDASDNTINPTSSAAESVSSQTLTISGFNNNGGVIPIYASYQFKTSSAPETWEKYELEGTLTVAYSSHVWRFQHNLIQGMDVTAVAAERAAYSLTATDLPDDYGTTHGLTVGLKDWEPSTGEWAAATATIDEPQDGGAKPTEANRHWGMVRKIKGHTDVSMVYFYNHPCDGDNALIIPETEGLHIYSAPANEQMGVEMYTYGASDPDVTSGEKNTGDAKLFDGSYRCSNLMMLRGGRLVIPKVKPGQWIEVRWTRHKEDMAERLSMENLADVDGNYINKTYKIGNCFYNISGQTSTYMFQVPQAGTPKGDGTYVELDEDGCVDATFTVDDNIYISIQQIELHEPGWEFSSSMAQHLRGTIDSGETIDIAHQYVCDGATHTISLLPKDSQNAPNAPQVWSIDFDPTLTSAGATRTVDGATASFTYPADAYGKIYVTLTSYSQNERYVANRNTWVITVGKKPQQTYPYTWDFTKYRATTKTKVGSSTVGMPGADSYDNYYEEDPNYKATNPTGAHEYRKDIDTWTQTGNDEKVVTKGYDTRKYGSYFVSGAQLVSRGLGVLPETEGLGFSLNTLGNSDETDDESASLTLDMESTTSGDKARALLGNTWRNGKLSITAGGSIIVPTPGADFTHYYIYIRSSEKPSAVTNAEESAEYVDSEQGQYRYHFTANNDAVLTFDNAADVYAIGVTNKFKQLNKVGDVAWATESRDAIIDHSLTGYLTTNPVGAYAIIQQATNPVYSADHRTVNVSIVDQRYVVPAQTGLVLKQTESIPSSVTTYNVPLFVPAITTETDAEANFVNNLMRPNVSATTFDSEVETTNAIDGTTKDYYRFILAKRYMTWTAVKEGDKPKTVTPPTAFETREVAAFYRLHKYSSTDGLTNEDGTSLTESVDDLNTLGPNKAYLILPKDNIVDALWKDETAPAKPRYIGIVGVSDMADDIDELTEPQVTGKIYNLRGQEVDPDGPLPTGIYIKDGKKVLVK